MLTKNLVDRSAAGYVAGAVHTAGAEGQVGVDARHVTVAGERGATVATPRLADHLAAAFLYNVTTQSDTKRQEVIGK